MPGQRGHGKRFRFGAQHGVDGGEAGEVCLHPQDRLKTLGRDRQQRGGQQVKDGWGQGQQSAPPGPIQGIALPGCLLQTLQHGGVGEAFISAEGDAMAGWGSRLPGGSIRQVEGRCG